MLYEWETRRETIESAERKKTYAFPQEIRGASWLYCNLVKFKRRCMCKNKTQKITKVIKDTRKIAEI